MGKTFKGWSLASDGDVVITPGGSYTLESSTTRLFAIWEAPAAVSITYDVVLTGAAQAVKMNNSELFDGEGLFLLMSVVTATALLTSAVNLPLVFRFGCEKARILFYVLIGVICAVGTVMPKLLNGGLTFGVPPVSVALTVSAVTAAGYALSWVLSVKLYKNREVG